MASYSLKTPYRGGSFSGANFFQRQVKTVANVATRVIKRGVTGGAKNPFTPSSSGLPQIISEPMTAKTKLFIGAGLASLVLLGFAMTGRKKR